MTYHYTPSGHPTGQASINVLDLRAEYHQPGSFYLDGPIDAPDLIPSGGVRWQSNPHAIAHPAFQTHIVHREQI